MENFDSIIIGTILITSVNKDDPLMTLVFIGIAAVLLLFRFIFPIIGIVLSVKWMKKRQSHINTVPIVLIVFFSLWILYSIVIVANNILR